MRFIKSLGVLSGLILLFGMVSGVKAQVFNDPAVPLRGLVPYLDQLSGPIDNIDIVSGKLNLTIPLGSLPNGRGGIGYNLNLYYESNIYEMLTIQNKVQIPGSAPIEFEDAWMLSSEEMRGGWRYNEDNSYAEGDKNKEVNFPPPQGNGDCSTGVTSLQRKKVIFPDGSSHVLLYYHQPGTGQWPHEASEAFYGFDNNCAMTYLGWPGLPQNATMYSQSGTYLYKKDDTLYFTDGRRIETIDNDIISKRYRTFREYDANGNYIEHEFTSPTGCINLIECGATVVNNENGSNIVIERGKYTSSNNNWRRDIITVPGPNGDNIVYSIDWEKIQVGGNGTRIANRTYPIYQYFPYQELNLSMDVIRFIQLPFYEHTPLSAIASGQVPPAYNSYEFRYTGGEYHCGKFLGATGAPACPNAVSSTMGLLDYIRTPSGAIYEYEYDYQDVSASYNFAELEKLVRGAYIKKKKVTYPVDNNNAVDTMQWTFTRSLNSQTMDVDVSIINPDGGKTAYHYIDSNNGFKIGSEIRIEEFDSGGIKARERRQFGQPWARTKEIESIFDSSGNGVRSAITEYIWDVTINGSGERTTSGNLLEKIEYDWVDYKDASGNNIEDGTTIKRKTKYDYYTPVGTNYQAPLSTSMWPEGGPRRLNAVKRMTVYEGGSTARAATDYEYVIRNNINEAYTTGNVANERRWDSEKKLTLPLSPGSLEDSDSQVFSYTYDNYGNVTDIYEPSVSTLVSDRPRTHITYNAGKSYVTKVETGYPKTEKRTIQYDWYNNGVALWKKTDLDNNVTTEYIYDNAGRILEVREKIGGDNPRGTWTEYDEVNRIVTTSTDLHTYGDGLSLNTGLQIKTYYDGLGRVRLAQQSDGSALTGEGDGIKVKTIDRYPVGGRRVITSTPYRSLNDDTLEWSCTQYDMVGRITKVSTYKGSAPPTSCAPPNPLNSDPNFTGVTRMLYDAEYTTVTDPAGNQRQQKVDVLGRLIEVIEDPGGSGHMHYITTYAYDALDNLTHVTQGGQTRTFTYSTLSWLLSALNPESGTTNYTYYDSGDLKTKQDARNITSTMTYDALHRIKAKSYSDSTPAVTYTYHQTNNSYAPNIGQLKSVKAENTAKTYAATNTYLEYDAFGRVIASSHAITGTGIKTFGYEWYLNGELNKQIYPSGKVVEYDVDDAGRMEKVFSGLMNYANLTYAAVGTNARAADGRISKMHLGNGLYETREYRTPGTPTVYKLGTTNGGYERTQIEYDFKPHENNGNVQAQRVVRNNTTWSQSYEYDAVNRLSYASEVGGWNRTYGYDRYGNRYITSPQSGPSYSDPHEPTQQSDFSAANNRLTMAGTGYDAAGNQTSFDGMTLTYDAEGRNVSASWSGGTVTFFYDGEGHRVKKVSGGITTYYVYNALGQLAAEYDNSPSSVTTGTSYLFTDMLGSVRTITNSSGTVTECYDYLPFGRILGRSDNGRNAAGLNNCFPATPDTNLTSIVDEKFTGQKRDNETGLDFFEARYFSSPLGRFTSTDPLNIPNLQQLNPGLFSKVIANPQNWNGYSYSHNNPLNKMDPDGYLTIIVPGTRNNHDEWEEDEFRKLVEKTFGEKAIVLDNNKMGNDKKSRNEAANKINDIIKNHEFSEGEQLNIVAHSHGGNAVFEATQIGMDHKIDNLVTMGTPIRNDYIPDFSKVDNFLNVFSRNDSIQPLGSGFTLGARRMFFTPSVKNLDATGAGKPGHSDLWQKPDTWNLIIEPKLKK